MLNKIYAILLLQVVVDFLGGYAMQTQIAMHAAVMESLPQRLEALPQGPSPESPVDFLLQTNPNG